MKKHIALLFPMLAALVVGCSSVKVSPKYSATQKGPLSTLSPMTVALRVDDQRPVAERTNVGAVYNNFGGVALKVESTEDAAAVVRDALCSEFEFNGHRVVPAPQADANAEVDVALNRLFYECKPHFWDVEVLVTISTDVKVKRLPEVAPPTQTAVNSTFRKSRQFVGRGSHLKIINRGLAEFIRAFSLDPKIQQTLGEPKPVSSSQ